MGRLGDRVGTRVRVAVGGRSPMIAADAVGTLAIGWPYEQLDALQANLPDETIHAFAFEEAPGVRIYFSAEEFRGAQLTGDHLMIQASEDIEVTVEPAVE